jgi:hypothetical protein
VLSRGPDWRTHHTRTSLPSALQSTSLSAPHCAQLPAWVYPLPPSKRCCSRSATSVRESHAVVHVLMHLVPSPTKPAWQPPQPLPPPQTARASHCVPGHAGCIDRCRLWSTDRARPCCARRIGRRTSTLAAGTNNRPERARVAQAGTDGRTAQLIPCARASRARSARGRGRCLTRHKPVRVRGARCPPNQPTAPRMSSYNKPP